MASNEPPAKKARTASEEEPLNKSVNVKKILEQVAVCMVEIEKLNDKARKEILEVEQKYNKLRKPYFCQRNDHFKRIPRFWMAAFTQHPHLSTIIQEEEKDCLKYITDLIAEDFEDIRLGYQISFYFKPNPYFENKVITKTMHLATTAHARSESTPIKWKKGKDLIFKYSEKIARCAKRKRQIPATFFSWFLDNSNPTADEVAETIKEDLWPGALQYFLGPDVENKNGKGESGEEHESSDDVQEVEDEEEYEEYGDEEVPDESEDMSDDEDKQDKPDPMMKEDSIAEAELEGHLGGDDDSQSYHESDEDNQEEIEEIGEQEDEEMGVQGEEEMGKEGEEEFDDQEDEEMNEEDGQVYNNKNKFSVINQDNKPKTENKVYVESLEDSSAKEHEGKSPTDSKTKTDIKKLECSKVEENNGKSSEIITDKTRKEESLDNITPKNKKEKSSEHYITKAISESPKDSTTETNEEKSMTKTNKEKT